MPRRLRQLRADLRKAGFIEQRDRGKVSHVRWYHPLAPETTVTLSGHDNDDARAYQELDVRKAISRVRQASESGASVGNDTEWIDVAEQDEAVAARYAMVIEWSDEDDAFVVSVPDIYGFHTQGSTREEAARMGDEALALWIAGARQTGVPLPVPAFSPLRAYAAAVDQAERIREIRRRLAVSQRDFAEMLNVSLSTVRSWEQGLRAPDGASLRLLDIAERQPDVLLNAPLPRQQRTA